ncbi:MAG: C40 family peptidase, partial [Actinomycetota bacterium]
MTNPVDAIDADSGTGRIDPLIEARQAARQAAAPTGADGATFAALVERAAGHRPGNLVDDLPTGRAAESWARWQPPSGALGTRSVPDAASSLAGASATNPTLGLGSIGNHSTGVVFPQAQSVGEAVVNAAATHLGVPYLWGGTDAEHGFDCSGLIQDAYRQIGVELPKWSRHQATMGVEVPSIDAAKPGDILTFGQPVNHVALYVGDGKMLHAPRTGEVVKIEEIDRPINSIRRVVDGASGLSGLNTSP